jgi:hypothetical protein
VEGDRRVAVLYGSDIDSTVFGAASVTPRPPGSGSQPSCTALVLPGSGFPTKLDDPYSKFGWNLNVLPALPESLLKHADGISGISMPWVYVGMLFSSFCWHGEPRAPLPAELQVWSHLLGGGLALEVEDNYLYSINYMHIGAGKRWYGRGPSCPFLGISVM